MDAFRRVMANARLMFSKLSRTGAALILVVLVLMAVGLYEVVHTSSARAMEELMPDATPAEQARAKEYLDSVNMTYEAKGGRLYVPAGKRESVIAMLAEGGKLPDDTSKLFNSLVNGASFMNTHTQEQANANFYLESTLRGVLKNFKSIRDATVIINAPEPNGFGTSFRKPTASVTVFTKPGHPMDKELVDAIAAMISGAKSGMDPADVKITDGTTGRLYMARNPNEVRSGDYMEHKLAVEQQVQEKLSKALQYIRGVIVEVNVQVDIRQQTSSTTMYLQPGKGTVSVPITEESSTKTDTAVGSGAEPGPQSNVAQDINQGGSGASRSNDTQEKTTSRVGLGQKTENTVDPRGMPTRISAMVTLPREYIIEIIKQDKGASAPAGGAAPAGGGGAGGAAPAEPTSAEIDTAFAKEKARIESDLQPLVETASADAGVTPAAGGKNVVVSLMPVPMSMQNLAGTSGDGGMQSAGLGGSASSIGALVGSPGGLIRTGILGVLVLAAMGMMLMMVRKAAKPLELPSPSEIVGVPPALQPQSDLVGEADETQTAMEGIELGDDELKTKKMLEQVAEMVKKNPADAASLVNRWVTTNP